MPDLVTWMLVFVRISAILAVFPLFSAQNVPIPLRIGAGALLSVLIAPFIPAISFEQVGLGRVVVVLFQEISAGLLLGFLCRVLFAAFEAAGNIVSSEMGFSMASVFNPAAPAAESVPALALYWLGLMLMLTGDLHHALFAAFYRSYELLPVGSARLSPALLEFGMARAGGIFVIAVEMTAPVLACSFIVTLVMALLGRAVPQMNVFAESFPVRTLSGLIIFGTTCNLMALHIMNYLRRLPEDVLQLATLAAGPR